MALPGDRPVRAFRHPWRFAPAGGFWETNAGQTWEGWERHGRGNAETRNNFIFNMLIYNRFLSENSVEIWVGMGLEMG